MVFINQDNITGNTIIKNKYFRRESKTGNFMEFVAEYTFS